MIAFSQGVSTQRNASGAEKPDSYHKSAQRSLAAYISLISATSFELFLLPFV
jgi:hypothetical protein